MRHDPGMSLIVKTITRWLKAFILMFGVYLVVYGHLSPGGGFSGGVIIACSFILLVLADGQKKTDKTLSRGVAKELDSIGALIFLCVALLGLILGGTFFINWIGTSPESHFQLFSSGIIPIANIGIGLKVGTSLFMVFSVLAALHVFVKKKEES